MHQHQDHARVSSENSSIHGIQRLIRLQILQRQQVQEVGVPLQAFDRLQQAQTYALEQLELLLPSQASTSMPETAQGSSSAAPCTSSPRRLLRMVMVLTKHFT